MGATVTRAYDCVNPGEKAIVVDRYWDLGLRGPLCGARLTDPHEKDPFDPFAR